MCQYQLVEESMFLEKLKILVGVSLEIVGIFDFEVFSK
jgi:hypothetical protein